MEYYDKYLKYKNKYLKIKYLNLYGGFRDIKLIKKMYKGSILHAHYSGYVTNEDLLNRISKYINNIKFKNNILSFTSYEVKQHINKKKLYYFITKNKYNFTIIGLLWYGIIKNVIFFEDYHDLIIKDMIKNKVSHIDFRINIGSHFMLNNGIKKNLSMEEEFEMFYKIKELYKKYNKSFNLICQYGKCKLKAYEYFSEILYIIKKNNNYKELIIAFDIVGPEDECSELEFFKNDIIKLKEIMTNINIYIPFYFHAGETQTNIKKSLNNVKFALQYGNNRIAHGINVIYDDNLLQEIIEKKILLEICPLSNVFLENIKDKYIYKKLYDRGVIMSVSPDDPNKLNDTTIVDNFIFLYNHGFTYDELKNLVDNSIKYSIINI